MEQPSNNELTERLAWSKHQISMLEEQCETWRNQALLAQAKVRTLEADILKLQQKLNHSLPLYDPDEYASPRDDDQVER